VAAHWPAILAALAALIVLKAAMIYLAARALRLSRPVAAEAALLLAPAGEFAFVVFAVAAGSGVLTPEQSGMAVATASISMALVPALGAVGRRLGPRLGPQATFEPEATVLPPADHARRAIVVGYGRVGRLVCD